MYDIDTQIKNKVICGNSVDILKHFPTNCIDLVVTSPPYYNLRNYHHKNQIGTEQTPQDYIKNLIDVFRECKRVIKKTGSIWVNIADSFPSGGGKAHEQSFIRDSETLKDKDISLGYAPIAKLRATQGKCLLGIPERFVIAMQDELGLIRRNTIIWYKPSCMPSSAKDRFTIDFEYFYFFVKSNEPQLWRNEVTRERINHAPSLANGKEGIDWEWFESNGKKLKRSLWKAFDYYFETQYEPMKTESLLRNMRGVNPNNKYNSDTAIENTGAIHSFQKPRLNIKKIPEYNGTAQKDYVTNGVQNPSDIKKRMIESWNTKIKFGGNKYPDAIGGTYTGNIWVPNENLERIKRTVWTINTGNSIENHFASYPEQLIETPIKACCPKKICNRCYQPIEKKYKSLLGYGSNEAKTKATNDTAHNMFQLAQRRKYYNSLGYESTPYIEDGIDVCSCNAGFHPGIVLDPFCGSGTTLLKARKMERSFVGVELNPEYCNMINRRLNNMITSYILKE